MFLSAFIRPWIYFYILTNPICEFYIFCSCYYIITFLHSIKNTHFPTYVLNVFSAFWKKFRDTSASFCLFPPQVQWKCSQVNVSFSLSQIMYSVECPFNEEDLLNNLLHPYRHPSRWWRALRKPFFKKLKKRRKKVAAGNVTVNNVIFKIVLVQHRNTCRESFCLDALGSLCSKCE